MTARFATWGLAAGLGLTAAPVAMACAFHTYAPDPTLVDVLMGSAHVVVARPDPAAPSVYRAVDALIGPMAFVEIPIAVDGDTRAALAATPDAAVLFARDGSYGPWLQLAVLDAPYRGVIDTVVARRDAWIMGDYEDRFQLFAGRLNDPNPDLRRLALMELDRADYSVLRRLDLPDVTGLGQDLEGGEPELRPIRLLLAGLSKDAALIPVLAEGLVSAVARDVPYLGAYATALVELAGPQAVAQIIDLYLAPETLPLATREKIVEALAIHSQSGPAKTKRAIRRGMSDLLDATPELAAAVARQFGFRSDWTMARPIKAAYAAAPPQTVADIFAVTQYIAVAEGGN